MSFDTIVSQRTPYSPGASIAESKEIDTCRSFQVKGYATHRELHGTRSKLIIIEVTSCTCQTFRLASHPSAIAKVHILQHNMPICRCRALGCGAYPGGQEISARQVRQHEAEDRKQALRERTLELETRQAAAIARQEERMVNAMQALAVSDSGLEVAAEIGTKYRMDRVRKAVDEAGVIFDRIVALRSDFSVYHDQPTSVAGFLERQDVLDKLTADCSQMMVDLQLLKKTSKSESVQTMCDRALSELQRYSDEIRASKTNLHLARHERESRLKTSPRTTYDTGESMSLWAIGLLTN